MVKLWQRYATFLHDERAKKKKVTVTMTHPWTVEVIRLRILPLLLKSHVDVEIASHWGLFRLVNAFRLATNLEKEKKLSVYWKCLRHGFYQGKEIKLHNNFLAQI